MHIGLFINGLRDEELKVSKRLIGLMEKRGIEYSVSAIGTSFFDGISIDELAEKSTLIIALGGDGTVLSAQQSASKVGIPVLGVNLGHIGFLAETEPSSLDKVFDKLISGDYDIEERTMLKVTKGEKFYYALNEIVISKGINTRPIKIVVNLDGKLLDKYMSDGIILATPTGSTAYSLSAGGPILGPDIEAFIINPICAHSLHSRPIVISDKHKAEFFAIDFETPAQIIIDGRYISELAVNEKIFVEKAINKAKFIKLSNTGFYDKLLQKLNYWGVTVTEKE